MIKKTDPVKDFQQAIEDAAQRLADSHLVNATLADWQVSERAMQIAREKRDDSGEKKKETWDQKLQWMSNAEFDRRVSYGEWGDIE